MQGEASLCTLAGCGQRLQVPSGALCSGTQRCRIVHACLACRAPAAQHTQVAGGGTQRSGQHARRAGRRAERRPALPTSVSVSA